METGQQIGWIVGIGGSLIGLAGGIFGTYCSIKNTNGPRERAFLIKASVVCWIGVLIFLTLFFALPIAYRCYMWIPYAIILPLGIIYSNRTQQKIRKSEAEHAAGKSAPTDK